MELLYFHHILFMNIILILKALLYFFDRRNENKNILTRNINKFDDILIRKFDSKIEKE